jgi:phosphatidylglycerol lysyltransferase
VGPWQFFCVLALGLFGVDPATAAGFSLVAFVLLTVPLVAGGAIALATSPFSWSELRHLPRSGEPFGGVLDLVAEAEGTLLPGGELEPAAAQTIDRLFNAYGYHFASALATEGDLRRFLAPDGDGFLAFTVEAGVALSLGDPVAPPVAVPALVRAFEATLATEGVDQFLHYGVSPRAAPSLIEAGYHLMPLGPEAIFYLDDFTLEGGQMKRIRNQVNHMRHDGARVVEVVPDARGGASVTPPPQEGELSSDEIIAQMAAVAAEWEEARNLGGLGFTVSAPRLEQPRKRRYFTLIMGRQVEGFFTYQPIPARNGWYLDNERRRADAPAGTTEFLVAESHALLKAEGADLVSWGTTALARPGSMVTDPFKEEHRLLDEAFNLAYRALGFFYSYEGLYRNKAKYRPVWEESYLAFRPRFGPRMAYAVVKAHYPDGVSQLLLTRLRAGHQEATTRASAPEPQE